MNRRFAGFVFAATVCASSWASPARVASCVEHVLSTFRVETKVAAKLCSEFRSPVLYTCFQQAVTSLGLTPEQGVDLCRKAETLTPVNCFQLVRVQTKLSPAEAAVACHGDRP